MTTAGIAVSSSYCCHHVEQSAELKQHPLYLLDDFYIVDDLKKSKQDKKIKVQLNDEGILLKSLVNKNTAQQFIRLNDIVGCRCGNCKCNKCSNTKCSIYSSVYAAQSSKFMLKRNQSNDVDAYLTIYAYVRKEKPLRRIRIHRVLKFNSFPTYEENLKYAQRWHQAIKANKRINSRLDTEKPLLIILNPKSGSGSGRQIFHNKIFPILQEADVLYEVVVTTHANCARELIRQGKDLPQRYSGIVVASGDGLLFEVLNGIMERLDWHILVKHLPLGIIPCGSGNGLARSIAHLYNEPYEPQPIESATLTCISGKTSPMDVVLVERWNNNEGKSNRMFSFLSVGWGLIADIDIESEKLRSIGAQRFTLWSVYRLLHLKTYKGRISYLPFNGKLYNQDSTSTLSSSQIVDVVEHQSFETASNTSRRDSWHSCSSQGTHHPNHNANKTSHEKDKTSKMKIIDGDGEAEPLQSTIPPLNRPVPDTWHSEDGEFVLVQAAYISHLAAECHFAPDAKLNDGIIYLVIIRAGIRRRQLLNFLINMNTGTHLNSLYSSYVDVIPVTAFRLEPFANNGIMTVDGERIACGPIQAEIFPGLMNVMTPNT